MPFSMNELLARLRALLRRRRDPAPTVLRVADLELDLVARQARRGTGRIQLTHREFVLLELPSLHRLGLAGASEHVQPITI